jgi:hypothetical protein
VAADTHGTGYLDLVVIDNTGAVTLLSNQGAGVGQSNQFQVSTVANWALPSTVIPVNVALGDFDEDHRQDLIVLYKAGSGGTSGFAFLPGSQGQAVLHDLGNATNQYGLDVGYLNGDTHLDVAVNSGQTSNKFAVAYGDGKGGFSNPVAFPAVGTVEDLQAAGPMAVFDINRDGLPDIAYAGQFGGQSGVEGIFQDPADPFPDWVSGFGVFTGAGVPALRLVATDLNGDLRPDLVVLPRNDGVHPQQLRVLINNGEGSTYFSDAETFGPTNVNFSDLIAADLNGDGLTDLVLLGSNNTAYVFLNQTTSTRRITVPLGAGVGSADNDFTSGQVAPLYGAVYDDADGNGGRDAGEVGRAGVTVFLDLVGDGIFHRDRDPWTVTDANGTYAFPDPPSGSYSVRIVPEPGRLLTDRSNASHSVTVVNGVPSDTKSQDFGTALALLEPAFSVTLDEGAGYSFVAHPAAAAAGRSLTFSLDAGAPAAAQIDPASGLFTWTPTGAEVPGSYLITLRVTDSAKPTLSQSEFFTVAVQATPAYQFVRALYRDLLGRAAEPAGLKAWASMLLQGVSRTDVAAGIWNSAEHRGIEVDDYYAQFLHRKADPAGRQAWINAMLAGMSETDVERAFLTSDEYVLTHPDSTAYVFGLYADVLGRQPDPNGLLDWEQAALNGASRADLAQSFLTSEEADVDLLDSYYADYLGRTPEPSGQAGWLGALTGQLASPASVGEAILASVEYFNRARLNS